MSGRGAARAGASETEPRPPGPEAVEEARERLRGLVRETPVLTSFGLDTLAGARLFFKCENFQRVGAFKFRGAANTLWQLDRSRLRAGVATHSSGNHGAALALAARLRGVKAYVVMPEDAPEVKKAAVRGYGAEIRFCGRAIESRQETLDALVAETGCYPVHPYNDPRIVAGQGTVGLELLEQVPDLDVIVAPIGGGGLISGIALAAAERGVAVVGAEPSGADDAYRSLATGRLQGNRDPRTVADGLLAPIGPLTFAVIRSHVQEILTVGDEDIVRAMRLIWERLKVVAEPSAAVPLAAVLAHPDRFAGRRVGIVISGGNVDLDRLPWARR
ncbi:MAG: pyridoxal-phosphate dependent enzyme [Acidobacteria bacterium]|nr:MAG: pyridoxal-phosphate dependent enzyme [Acidobacteriota bacterium]